MISHSTMILQATTRAEHRFWVLNLVKLCTCCQYRGSTISGTVYNNIILLYYAWSLKRSNVFILYFYGWIAKEYEEICSHRQRPSDAKDDDGDMLKISVKRSDGAELLAPPSPKSSKQKVNFDVIKYLMWPHFLFTMYSRATLPQADQQAGSGKTTAKMITSGVEGPLALLRG